MKLGKVTQRVPIQRLEQRSLSEILRHHVDRTHMTAKRSPDTRLPIFLLPPSGLRVVPLQIGLWQPTSRMIASTKSRGPNQPLDERRKTSIPKEIVFWSTETK